MGISKTLGLAFRKASIGAGNMLPSTGTVFVSVNDSDKLEILNIARDFFELGFNLIGTEGTATLLKKMVYQLDKYLKLERVVQILLMKSKIKK